MTRVAIASLWLLHFLPAPLLWVIGVFFGLLLYVLAYDRRRVTRKNLQLCFPQQKAVQREWAVIRHLIAFGVSFINRTVVWWGSPARLQRWVRLEGWEHYAAHAGKPVILLAPHFVGLDVVGSRLTMAMPFVSMFGRQKNPAFDRLLLHGRQRFATPTLVDRQAGLRPVLKALKHGCAFYYLPDMDFGSQDAVFVPFFGVAAATVSALPRLARLSGAVVIPVVAYQRAWGGGYVARFYPAWDHFPSEDLSADIARMNAFIEARVNEMPSQYFWLHKRFKTRPPGEARFYR